MTLKITGNADADALLGSDAFALLTGMLLDQQVTMESAFAGPQKILERTGTLDPAAIAAYGQSEFLDVFKQSPAVHRFPGSMAARVQALAETVQRDWGGDTSAIWTMGNPDGREVLRRLMDLPGFGEQKAKIFLALLGKQFGLKAADWREAAGHYGEEGVYVSVADVVDAESLAKVRASKKAAKTAARAAP